MNKAEKREEFLNKLKEIKKYEDLAEDFIEVWKNGDIFKNFRANGQKGCQARALIFSGDVKKGDPYDLNSYKNYRAKI